MPSSTACLTRLCKRVAAGMAHDDDAGGLGGQSLLELFDHGFRRPAGELRIELVDPQRGGGLRGAGLASQYGAFAGMAAHLHVDGQTFAGRVGGNSGGRACRDTASAAALAKSRSLNACFPPIYDFGSGPRFSRAGRAGAFPTGSRPPESVRRPKRAKKSARRCGSSTKR